MTCPSLDMTQHAFLKLSPARKPAEYVVVLRAVPRNATKFLRGVAELPNSDGDFYRVLCMIVGGYRAMISSGKWSTTSSARSRARSPRSRPSAGLYTLVCNSSSRLQVPYCPIDNTLTAFSFLLLMAVDISCSSWGSKHAMLLVATGTEL